MAHFGDLFSQSIKNANQTPGRLSKLTGISKQTLVSWANGRVARPRHLPDILSVAAALRLYEDEVDALLTAAEYASVSEMLQQAMADQDVDLLSLLGSWQQPNTANGSQSAQATTRIEIALPPAPTQPPQPIHFVGRKTEQAYYEQKLTQDGLAVITGMAGVGKTTLAAALATDTVDPQKQFWHSFHESDGVDTLLWKLAGFLARGGQDSLWNQLQISVQMGTPLPPLDSLLDSLVEALRGHDYLLCLDDYHHVEDDPQIAQLIERLQIVSTEKGLALLLTTRRIPSFVEPDTFAALDGLSLVDTADLLELYGIHLDKALLQELHSHTAGNAELLILAFDILNQAEDPELFVQQIAEADDISLFLLMKIDDGLTGKERSVLGGVATMMGHPVTLGALEVVLNAGSVERSVQDLLERHLLGSINEDADNSGQRSYTLHAIVRDFYYHELGRRRRRQMHQRAGGYYAEEEVDPLRSGIHYAQAGEFAMAAMQATTEVWSALNQGRSRLLYSLLQRFKPSQLEPRQWAEVNLAHGLTSTFLDAREDAGEQYQTAFSVLSSLPSDASIRELTARACRGMGDLLEDEDPPKAMTWLKSGMDQLQETSGEEYAALLIKIGNVHLYLGEYDEAKKSLLAGLDALPHKPHQLQSVALMNLSSIQYYQGKQGQAIEFAQQGIAICQQLGDRYQEVNLLIALANAEHASNNWADAIRTYEKALEIAQSLGSVYLQSSIRFNLGLLLTFTGDENRALEHFEFSLDFAQTNNVDLMQAFILVGLSWLHIRMDDWPQATEILNRAQALAESLNSPALMSSIGIQQAEIKLLEEEIPDALEHAQHAVQLAQELGDPQEEAISLRMLGRVLLTCGELISGQEKLEESLTLLAENNQYQAAQTKIYLGMALANQQDAERGLALLQEAESTFRILGAKRDLDLTEKILLATSR